MQTIKEAVRKSILEADEHLKETDVEFMHQAILLASGFVGAEEEAIAEELEFDPEFVRSIGSRLRTAGIWSGDDLNNWHRDAWCDQDKGGVAFMLDAAVAGGTMILKERREGEPLYSLSPAGLKRVESLGITK